MDMAQPGRAISRNISKGEMVEAEIDAFISKRASQDRRPDRVEQEELWKESVRRHNDRLQEERRAAWCEHHQDQAARLRTVLEALVARHEGEAAKLMEDRPKGVA